MNINGDDIIELYPYCGEDKDQEHIIKCNECSSMCNTFCIELKEEFKKVETYTEDKDDIDMMVVDIEGYLNSEINLMKQMDNVNVLTL